MSNLCELPCGYTCECGARHQYPAYVFAHWDISLKHKCSKCGRTNTMKRGVVKIGRKPKASK